MFGFLRSLLGPPPAPTPPTREQAVRQARAAAAKVMTPERAELIRHAMAVHRAKQTVLADLSDEQRQKLVALAIRRLLSQERDPDQR